jgi:glutaredoxin
MSDKVGSIHYQLDLDTNQFDKKAVLVSARLNKLSNNFNKIGDGFTRDELLEAVPTARTVPQIFIDEQLIGGFTELKQHLEKV